MAKEIYFELGPKASIFYDPATGLKVTPGRPGKVLAIQTRGNNKIKVAKANQHIIEVTEAEYRKQVAHQGKVEEVKSKISSEEEEEEEDDDTSINFEKMNKDQLYTFYVEEYEVTEDEKAEFKDLKKAEMIEKLVSLEEADDQEEE